MKVKGNTINKEGDLIPVFECEFCEEADYRSTDENFMTLHEEKHREEIDEHHKEEAVAGIL